MQIGRTDLHDAAERGDVEAVSWLLATPVDINSRTEVRVILTLQEIMKTLLLQEGESALFLASRRGHEEVVGLLIEANALINIQDNVRWTNTLSPKTLFTNAGWTVSSLLGITEGSRCNSKTPYTEES